MDQALHALFPAQESLHCRLEERLAEFKGTEAALLFNSGYAANTGIIPAVATTDDVILSDSLNHASIIDGCRLSKAQVYVYRHRDVNHVEDILKKTAHARRRLIVTDGVFSMDGDIAPLPELVVPCQSAMTQCSWLTTPMPRACWEQGEREQQSISALQAA